MRMKIQKCDDNLAVFIPELFANIVGLTEDGEIELSIYEGKLVIEPTKRPHNRPTLDELLSRMTEENAHDEIDTGAPVGKEVW